MRTGDRWKCSPLPACPSTITGSVLPGLGHDASIREIVRRNASGLLPAATIGDTVSINYYDDQGQATVLNSGGNLVELVVARGQFGSQACRYPLRMHLFVRRGAGPLLSLVAHRQAE